MDTNDLRETARTLAQADAELASIVARLPGDAATIMPPAIAAEVASAVAETTVGVVRVATRYTASGFDLARRAVAAEIGQAVQGLGPRWHLPKLRWTRPGGPLGNWMKQLGDFGKWASGLGSIELGSVGASAERWLVHGSWSGSSGPASGQIEAGIGATGSASASAKAGLSGIDAEASAHGFAGGRVDASGRIGNDFANINAGGSGMVGVEGSAGAGIHAGLDGVSEHAELDAFAGAKAEGQVGGQLSGVSATAQGGVWAGVGAHASVDAHVSLDDVHFHPDIGIALGLGGHVSFDVDIKPTKIASDVWHGLSHIF